MIRVDQDCINIFNWKPVKKKPLIVHAFKMTEDFSVITLEGTMLGKPGDYLMKGVNNELYVCQKDIFEKTYEVIKDELPT